MGEVRDLFEYKMRKLSDEQLIAEVHACVQLIHVRLTHGRPIFPLELRLAKTVISEASTRAITPDWREMMENVSTLIALYETRAGRSKETLD